MTDIKVGDTLYMFDGNRRKYAPGNSGPIYREHFYPVVVVGETPRSWLVGPEWGQVKVSKKDPWSVLFTAEMVNDAVWMNEHRHRIASRVGSIRDMDVLRKIAAIVGYTE